MNEAFYISNGGDALGPYEIDQLRSMWNSGQITANTLYWNEGKKEWRGISELEMGEKPKESTPESTQSAEPIVLSTEERQDLYKRRSNAFVVDLLIYASCFVAAAYFASNLSGAAICALVLAGFSYLLFKDSLFRGQSVGKRFYKIQTVQLRPSRLCSPLRSLTRNGMLWGVILGPFLLGVMLLTLMKGGQGAGVFMLLIPAFIVVFMLAQLNRIRVNPCGQTLPDEWSSTQVIRFKTQA